MRYIVATIGAVFMFVAVVVLSLLADGFLPPAFQGIIAVHLGFVVIRGNPALLIGVVVALAAGLHSFRSTLKRYRAKDATPPTNT